MDKFDWIHLDSSLIEKVAYQTYSGDFGILFIQFKTGKLYQYAGVESGVFQDFCESESPGRFYNAKIKGKYEQGQFWDFTQERAGND